MKVEASTFSGPAQSCWFRLLLLLGFSAFAYGCAPDIGDKCSNSTDCSIAGDRLCDTTQPNGYCTIFNCEPSGCPDKSACVVFGERTCSVLGVSSRFRRTFCMATCKKDNDCRESDGYRCVDVSNDPAWRVVDPNPATQKICVVPSSKEVSPIPPDPPVCYPSDASFDVSRPEAGPSAPDADAPATPIDVAIDGADATTSDRRSDTPEDVLDSNRVETSTDIEPDTQDDGDDGNESSTPDASGEPSGDEAMPDDANDGADAGTPPDVSAD